MRIANACVLALLTATGCEATSLTSRPGHAAPDSGSTTATTTSDEGPPAPACPIDPDAYIGGDPSLYECPDYWVCETTPTGKTCTNPGPDFPDSTHEWTCEDVGGATVCRSTDFPDGGASGDWSCERRGEFVVCTDATPSYPDEASSGPWVCEFSGEFRICTSSPPGDSGGWTCFDTTSGRQCRQSSPEYPDDRVWSCYDTGGETVCVAPGALPDGGGSTEWICTSMGDLVVCRDATPDFPDEGSGGAWDCTYATEFRVCVWIDTGGGDGPGSDGGLVTMDGGSSTDGGTSRTDGGTSICIPGRERWCDDHVYCSWGRQTCTPDGRWGPCIEPSRDPRVYGVPDRPHNHCGCRYFYFHEACCEDQRDRDGDGHADCYIPADHTPPECATDGTLCSFCDTASDCGGRTDICIFRTGGYTFCSRDCSSTPCPPAYECHTITLRSGGYAHQCVPPLGTTCEML